MPTARELLEQADALMRRNRAAAVDDIPVLTDSVALPAEMPSAAGAAPAFTDVAAPAPRAAPHVPTLTEAVAVTGAESVDSVIQEGEPSDWLHLDREGPSIIGDAPDSIAIVPQVARPPVSDAEAIASAELEEIELTTPADEAFDDEFAPADTYFEADAMPLDVAPPAAVPAVTPAPPSAEAWFAPWSSTGAVTRRPGETDAPVAPLPPAEPVAAPADDAAIAVVADSAATPEPEGLAAEVAAAAAGVAGPAFEEESTVAGLHAAVDAPTPEEPAAPPLPERAAESASPPAEEVPAAAFAAPPAVPAPLVAVAADDAAKWEAIAEEIRVQVLQRIDLFTDTGLREQLGMRLKPIVDRASADLVATINLHVGELLRAYVAEAIEREIENWRNDH
jgi:hypothetical protein